MEAEVTIEYQNAKIAGAVVDSVSPDNLGTPRGLSVKTRRDGRKFLTKIVCHRGFPTFVATIDDVLSSLATAEKILRGATPPRRQRQTSV